MATFTIEDVKKLPLEFLLQMINVAKKYLKTNEATMRMFKEKGVDIELIDLIPINFGDLDVSARTNKGIITLNYKLLCDGDFYKDFSYLIHESEHWLQQCFGDRPTKGSDTGSYLDNPYEQEAFQHQVEFMADEYGENEAEKYVDHLLDHHEIDNKKEKQDKKDELMKLVD
jgi:hypothetical protein